jgi:F-type H+-transporting ATPase subunit alpha
MAALDGAARRWLAALADAAGTIAPSCRHERFGVIERLGDGVAFTSPLAHAGYGELIELGTPPCPALLLELGSTRCGCVLLGDDRALTAGALARTTGKMLAVPAGELQLGRVIDPLGRPLDGGLAPRVQRELRIEAPAPTILDRAAVVVPLQTGIKAVDALVPIGRGQRELIVGDRGTGKTAIAVDAIIAQRTTGVACIYVAIGKKRSAIVAVVEDLRRCGALEHTCVVAADADQPAGLQFIAPYAGCAIGEALMATGRDVLIVYDDLTQHARAYRQISLLLRRPPGREAFPGDIFYVHSRLLERATRLAPTRGGGSLTALPIVETQAGDISGYIPTNLISITDGQIVLSAALFDRGIKPAIDIGRSVSRVGGKTQLSAMRTVAGRLKLDYAQYEELEAFTRFGARVDEPTQRVIDRGRRLRRLLEQPRLAPWPLGLQIVVLGTLARGAFDSVAVEQLPQLERQIAAAAQERMPELLARFEAGAAFEGDDAQAAVGLARELVAAEVHLG